MHEVATEMGSRPGVRRVPPPDGSRSSAGSTVPGVQSNSLSSGSSGASGYGVLLERPTLSVLPPTREEGEFPFASGYHLSEEEMRQLDRENVLPEEEGSYHGQYGYALSQDPTLVPPRLVDPDNAFAPKDLPRPPLFTNTNRFSVQSNPSSMESEAAALLTARRVNIGDVPENGNRESGTSLTQTGFLNAIGLSGMGIGHMSWFGLGNTPAPPTPPRNNRTSPSFAPLPSSDDDVEAARGLHRPDETDSFGRRGPALGLDINGLRPLSSVSARSATTNSAGTIWHDARTSLPGTPPLAAPPRALTPPEPAFPEQAWLTGQQHTLAPPSYDDPFLDHSPALNEVTENLPAGVDILDLPAPSALTHFNSNPSLGGDSGTVSSIGLSKNPFPPGLEYINKGKTWSRDGSLSAASSSPAWHHVPTTLTEIEGGASELDVLEEEPPHAGSSWKAMASGGTNTFGELGRRTTFGLVSFTLFDAFNTPN